MWKRIPLSVGRNRVGARQLSAIFAFQSKSKDVLRESLWKYLTVMAFITGGLSCDLLANTHCDPSSEQSYRRSEVEKHNSKASGVWVTYKDGVYDITNFIQNHPGGQDKILLAAGQDIEGFWNLYRQHYNSPLPRELLAGMRIGTLHPEDRVKASDSTSDANNPYRGDPILSPVMKYRQREPINAEAPGVLLLDSWITPTDLWFVRNHHPVPLVEGDSNQYEVDLVFAADLNGGEERDRGQQKAADGSSAPLISLSLNDLKTKYPRVSVISSIQCGGNRRSEMTQVERTNGSSWDISAMSTAKWTGVRLRDILADIGITEEALYGDRTEKQPLIQHVHFVALDGMEASIPIKKALSRFGDVLLAFEMNDQELPTKHGYPLRAVIPGHVGVRNVKWVKKIRLSSEEAQGPWQRGMAYKGFGPSVKSLENIDIEKIPSLQEQPVTSAVALPTPGSSISVGEPLTVKGYAYSGGGRGIVRVDVSIDGGKTWKTASLTEGSEQPLDRAWAWTFWECDFDITENFNHQSLEIISKATDASYNVQPDSVKGIWNLRGINNNAWHRIKVNVEETLGEQ